MANISIKDLINMAEEASVNYATTGSTKCSFSIVNSTNGKRLSFSKSLSSKLELSDKVHILLIPTEGKILLSNKALNSKSVTGSLSGKDKKISYSAQLVSLISKTFKLNFETKTSMSFSNITFDVVDGTTVAAVCLVSPIATYEEDDNSNS